MPRKARENTLAGFRLAVAAGVDAIELDVHATSDGIVVVHHDAQLAPRADPAAEATGAAVSPGLAIAARTLGALRQQAPYELATLREVLAEVPDRVRLYVEVKGRGIEPLVAALLHGHESRCAVHSFDHRVPPRVCALAPGLASGILSASYLMHPERALLETGARDYWQWWEMIDEALVDDVHAAGGRVIAWTVNDTEAVRRLAALGVDGVCTDVPDVVGAVARARARG
jgi:glycerophosphoryl diester phosphodiesterase